MTDRRPLVAVTRRLPDAVESALAAEFQCSFRILEERATGSGGTERSGSSARLATLRAAMAEAEALVSTVADPVPGELLAAGDRRVRLVANFGVGVDNIDLAIAREAGVVVSNTPDVLTDDTADLALALLLAAARRLGEGERLVRGGGWSGWEPTQLLGTRVHGKTLGIVGYGRIGRAVAQRARHGFGMRILYHQRTRLRDEAADPARPEWRENLHALLRECDFVSLHVPASAGTRHLIDAAALACLRPHTILVNTARGDIVDEGALISALGDGRIAAAGLDVYEREPAVPAELLAMPNVILLPHLGSATEETRTAMGFRVLLNLRAFFAGSEPPDRVV